MIAFGIGTMPAMILSGLGAARVSAFIGRNRIAAGLLIAVLGLATIAMPLTGMLSEDSHMHAAESIDK
jgi:sulfite exporter TauE/SafE